MNCPKCGIEIIEPFFAISRDDDSTKICPDCGAIEGFITFADAILWKKNQQHWNEQYPV